MHDAIVAWLSLWSQALLRAAWEGGLAAGVAWSIETCWTSMPVAWRSWMWRLVFVKTALAFMPLSIALPVLPAHPTPSDNAPMAAMAQDMRPTEVTDSDHRLATSPTLTLVGCGAWLLGMGVCAYVLGRGTRDVRRRLSASQPIVDASLLRAMRCLSDQLQVAKPQLVCDWRR